MSTKIRYPFILGRASKQCYKIAFLLGIVFNFTALQGYPADSTWQKSLETGDNMLANQNISGAQSLYQRAYRELPVVAHSPQDEIRCLNSLANSFALENKTNEAIKTYQQVLSLVEKSAGNNNIKLLPTLFVMGSIFESAGAHGPAMRYYQRALAIDEKYNSHNFIAPLNVSGEFFETKNIKEAGDVNDTRNYRLSSSAALTDSTNLLKSLPSYKEDLLKTEDNSDKELLLFFNSQLKNGRNERILSGSHNSVRTATSNLFSEKIMQPVQPACKEFISESHTCKGKAQGKNIVSDNNTSPPNRAKQKA